MVGDPEPKAPRRAGDPRRRGELAPGVGPRRGAPVPAAPPPPPPPPLRHSQCGDHPAAATQPETPPRGSRIVRFLRSRWARLPRVTSIWRRKKQPPARVAAAVQRDRRDQWSGTLTRPGFWAMAWTPKSAATLRFVVVIAAALAVAVDIFAAFSITRDLSNRRGGCDSKPIARWAKFLELMEHPPLNCNCKCLLGAPKRGLEWIFSK